MVGESGATAAWWRQRGQWAWLVVRALLLCSVAGVSGWFVLAAGLMAAEYLTLGQREPAVMSLAGAVAFAALAAYATIQVFRRGPGDG